MAEHNKTGEWGEAVAREYLLTQGYIIGAQNIRVGHSEIDFIAYKDDKIIFVEVKTRTSPISDPLDAITPAKIRNLARAADSYLNLNNIPQEPRFDVVAIIGTPQKYTLEHFEDAFFPPLHSY